MPLHTITFASSLLLIALFFALKEQEAYVGRPTILTRFLTRHSPAAEGLWNRCGAWIAHTYRSLSARASASIKRTSARITMTFRWIVVMLADKMIKAVRGEKLLEMNGAPSMYLKHLREHKDANNRARDDSTAS